MAKRSEFKNMDMEVGLFPKSNSKYDYNKICDFLKQIPFGMVELPLYSYNAVVFDNINRTGKLVVGYVSGYDPEKQTFSVTIYEKYAKEIGDFKQPIIYARTNNIAGNPVKLSGLDICPALYYANVR